ncbi:MAG: DsbA family protein [Woeseiaceae bacterium]
MKEKLRSLYFAWLLDPRFIEIRRSVSELFPKLMFRKRVVSVFLQLDDPYSYLLSHYLQYVIQRYQAVEFRFLICQGLRGEYMPEPALLAEHALQDCKLLAQEFGVPFLDKGDTPVVEYRLPLLEFLAAEQNEDDFAETMTLALANYWRGDTEGAARLMGRTYGESAETSVLIGKNQLLLRKMGHYNCATMHYSGEWYWGVDRLHYLVERLEELGLNRFAEPVPELASLERAMQLNLPATVPARAEALPALEMFHSFRSPYSYLALQNAFDIADSFGLKLQTRPLLPGQGRRVSVPKTKLRYFLSDASREARFRGVEFGKIADFTELQAERLIAAYFYAKDQGRERDFLTEVGKAIFAEGIMASSDEGMQVVAERAGLFWPELQEAMRSDKWRDEVKRNQERLADTGLWGVPVFKLGEQIFWGQDRAWLVARKIEDLCHGGEGIMI